ncbi:hypothetical protein QBC39DRAFT_182742 [Podospora conica]|nr:hypothetical protein QBC39DRAFT_182742 [Schizothecium conicum]
MTTAPCPRQRGEYLFPDAIIPPPVRASLPDRPPHLIYPNPSTVFNAKIPTVAQRSQRAARRHKPSPRGPEFETSRHRGSSVRSPQLLRSNRPPHHWGRFVAPNLPQTTSWGGLGVSFCIFLLLLVSTVLPVCSMDGGSLDRGRDRHVMHLSLAHPRRDLISNITSMRQVWWPRTRHPEARRSNSVMRAPTRGRYGKASPHSEGA